ncbi:uncharacterized protein LOC117178726 [Belonocnema kinseyi]|uniref:uncharacterized protein LOC117178726 n=1 Tax=Belonocnema kinseyi TaxID=2817044 RepID=UPI00143D581D|nr:uncharacterized protein LOC117178726 [Belonocnema kinseyi]
MDDIVIYAKPVQEHNEKFEKLLGRLKSAGLILQPDKCRFLCKEIRYLGHIISEDGVNPDPKTSLGHPYFFLPAERPGRVNANADGILRNPVHFNEKNSKEYIGGADVHDDAAKGCRWNISYFSGSNVLYH